MLTIDTNVLLYAFDRREDLKQPIASSIVTIMHARRLPLGLQVCGEFYNVLTRKFDKPPVAAAELARGLMTSLPLFAATAETTARALDLAAAGRFSFWDANLLSAAEAAGCASILSEDMADGAKLGRIEVVAPFRMGALTERARAILDA